MSKILIIEAVFYKDIATKLRQGAEVALRKQKTEYDIESVPGALEIPAALNFALESSENYDAYIVLGCVIRGETSHYDIVCNESTRGVYDLVLRHKLALGNGILTVENKDQAMERADPSRKNKGGDAAKATLHMLALKTKMQA
ncbi:MAG: 6,7-dimethyl-8-ribityllumazine synthase [Rhodospirillales bacterium]|nr:6,7-dimethyl-8-ribityllumazine synthase [Alphaproteobacteria bacterium]MCB9976576.1 6,7-dimethyl-8-ribityllumazine synthase [Rhodospirillales bacterium]